jgi:hypothetical protein
VRTINLIFAARVETPTVGTLGRGLARSTKKLSKLWMVSNDNGAVWIPGTAIHFGSLDFVVNNEGKMTRAREGSTPSTTDLPNIARALSNLQLGPPKEECGPQSSSRLACTEVVRVLDTVRYSFLDILLLGSEDGLSSPPSEASCNHSQE